MTRMGITRWLCTSNSKNMLVKIVHPGGHAELHDRPILASEIMLRNPKCVVAHPHVFQQPWAIVAPETTLMLGQKFYVVPISTIRKLQRQSFKKFPSPVLHNIRPQNSVDIEEEITGPNSINSASKDSDRDCCLYCLYKGDCCFSKGNCLMSLVTRIKTKANNGEEVTDGTRSWSTCSPGSSEIKGLVRRRNKDFTGGSPKRFSSLDQWQPSLEKIIEEQSN